MSAADPATSDPQATKLEVRNFAQIEKVDITLGDLTVLVGAQGVGKSLCLQWLKIALDGKQLYNALRSSGHPAERPEVLIDLIFGAGMAKAWTPESRITLNGNSRITLGSISKRGTGSETLFFVPAHRSMLISDGWAAPFQKLNTETPAVARLFSQNLYDRFSSKDAGALFPVNKRLKKVIRDQIDDAVFHGGTVGIHDDAQHARRLRLVHGDMHLPFMTWTVGQREFTPLLMGLLHLLPHVTMRKRPEIDLVVIEEPEMGLHPQAITAVMLLVLDLIWRGYRVVLSTHSPHVLSMLWMMRNLKELDARWQLVCDGFGVKQMPMRDVARTALTKDYRAYLLAFNKDKKVVSADISDLDPSSEDERIAGWGGLTTFTSRFADSVRTAANEKS